MSFVHHDLSIGLSTADEGHRSGVCGWLHHTRNVWANLQALVRAEPFGIQSRSSLDKVQLSSRGAEGDDVSARRAEAAKSRTRRWDLRPAAHQDDAFMIRCWNDERGCARRQNSPRSAFEMVRGVQREPSAQRSQDHSPREFRRVVQPTMGRTPPGRP